MGIELKNRKGCEVFLPASFFVWYFLIFLKVIRKFFDF